MFELSKNDYEKIRPLVPLHDDHLATYGVLAGTVPAQVYVDDPERPATFFFRAGHRYALAGDWNNTGFNTSLRKLFVEQIYPQEQQKGMVAFQLYYAPEDWAESIEQILAGKRLIPIRRQYYEYRTPQPDWRRQLPDGFVMTFVDRDFLETYKGLRFMDLLLEEMCSERPTVEDFLEKSFGVCLVHENDLVGWCLSEYNYADRCEIGIATLEPYQRRGFATLMTNSFVEYALSVGITRIGWHCFADNLGSAATALKAGFVKVRDYKAYLAWF